MGAGILERNAASGFGFLLACLLAAACSHEPVATRPPVFDTASYKPGVLYTVSWQGRERSFRVHLPAGKPWSGLPLVIALHGAGSSADEIEPYFGFDTVSNRERFAVAYPNGLYARWNVGGSYDNGVDDVGFVGMLIDTLLRRYPIDRDRVFVTGFSNGGFLAYRLARELSEKIIAIAPVEASAFDLPFADPPKQVAILHIHALDDSTVPFEGQDRNGVLLLPVDSTLAYFIRRNHCASPPQVLVNGGQVFGRRWKSASGHGDVSLYTTVGGDHRWPSLDASGLDGTELIWSFFRVLPDRP